MKTGINLWSSADHVLSYLARAEKLPYRAEGEAVVLEYVSSPTPALHEHFRRLLGVDDEPEDPSNQLLDVETQLKWLREIGYIDVDCYWKWLELALLIGIKPNGITLSSC